MDEVNPYQDSLHNEESMTKEDLHGISEVVLSHPITEKLRGSPLSILREMATYFGISFAQCADLKRQELVNLVLSSMESKIREKYNPNEEDFKKRFFKFADAISEQLPSPELANQRNPISNKGKLNQKRGICLSTERTSAFATKKSKLKTRTESCAVPLDVGRPFTINAIDGNLLT